MDHWQPAAWISRLSNMALVRTGMVVCHIVTLFLWLACGRGCGALKAIHGNKYVYSCAAHNIDLWCWRQRQPLEDGVMQCLHGWSLKKTYLYSVFKLYIASIIEFNKIWYGVGISLTLNVNCVSVAVHIFCCSHLHCVCACMHACYIVMGKFSHNVFYKNILLSACLVVWNLKRK